MGHLHTIARTPYDNAPVIVSSSFKASVAPSRRPEFLYRWLRQGPAQFRESVHQTVR